MDMRMIGIATALFALALLYVQSTFRFVFLIVLHIISYNIIESEKTT